MPALSGGWLEDQDRRRVRAGEGDADRHQDRDLEAVEESAGGGLVEALRQRRPPGCVEVRRDAQGRTDRALRAVRDRSRNAGQECIRQAA
jgi:hypothetical protein